MQVKSPSKKKMLRHVWMIMDDAPHAGMRARLFIRQYVFGRHEIMYAPSSEQTTEGASHGRCRDVDADSK